MLHREFAEMIDNRLILIPAKTAFDEVLAIRLAGNARLAAAAGANDDTNPPILIVRGQFHPKGLGCFIGCRWI